jgi:thymidine kinase
MLEVICGCMFSGKSEELVRRLRRAKIANVPIYAFKAAIDRRYHPTQISSHSGVGFDAQPVPCESPEVILEKALLPGLVAVDEAQFFERRALPSVVRFLSKKHRVIVAGLDLDFMERPFGAMGELLALAQKVTKLQAVCMICGADACRTQRLGGGMELVDVGASAKYEARCVKCYQHPGQANK